MTFTKAKHDWITAALGQFGLPGGRASTKTTRPGQPQPLAIDRGGAVASVQLAAC
jgi:hypothetical protein